MVRILGEKTGQKKGNLAIIGAGIFLSLVVGIIVGRIAPVGWPDTLSSPVITSTELQQWQPITQAQNEAMAERDRILTGGIDYGLAQASQQWQPITQAQNEAMAERDRILTGN
jgi:hypothetical protein